MKGLRERAKEYGATKQDLAEAARRPAKDQQAFLIPLILQVAPVHQPRCCRLCCLQQPGRPCVSFVLLTHAATVLAMPPSRLLLVPCLQQCFRLSTAACALYRLDTCSERRQLPDALQDDR